MAISGKQRLFNKVVRHLRRQGVAAKTDNHGCAYRGKNGTECAIGCLIPNKLYKPDMESKTAFQLLDAFPKVTAHLERLYGVTKDHERFLSNIQEAHDDYLDDYGLSGFESRIGFLAEKYNLKVPK